MNSLPFRKIKIANICQLCKDPQRCQPSNAKKMKKD